MHLCPDDCKPHINNWHGMLQCTVGLDLNTNKQCGTKIPTHTIFSTELFLSFCFHAFIFGIVKACKFKLKWSFCTVCLSSSLVQFYPFSTENPFLFTCTSMFKLQAQTTPFASIHSTHHMYFINIKLLFLIDF